jgi:hypothetical protein
MLRKAKILVAFTVVVTLLVSLGGVAFAAGQGRSTWTAFPQCKQGSAPVNYTKVIQVMLANYNSSMRSLIMNHGGFDGIFGSYTKQAVIAFQQANGLTADGIVGPNTWGKLYDRLVVYGAYGDPVYGGLVMYEMNTGYVIPGKGYPIPVVAYSEGLYGYFEGYPTNSWWVDVSESGTFEGNLIMFAH